MTISISLTSTCTTSSSANEESAESLSLGTQTITKNAVGSWSNTVAVTTSEGSFSSFGGLTTEGIAKLENVGSNPISLGAGTGAYFAKLKAGERYNIRLEPGLTVYHISTGGNSTLKITVLED